MGHIYSDTIPNADGGGNPSILESRTTTVRTLSALPPLEGTLATELRRRIANVDTLRAAAATDPNSRGAVAAWLRHRLRGEKLRAALLAHLTHLP